LINTYKGIAQANLQSSRTILFWSDMWNRRILKFHTLIYTHLPKIARLQ
jgi:hypothetical protein